MIARDRLLAIGVAAGVAVLAPLLLLGHTPVAPAIPAEPDTAPLAPPPQPPVSALFERPLFAVAAASPDEAPPDAPQLVGIAGRLDRDAVAMVRTADGTTRTLAVGESVDGWRLASLAIDAAFFTRGRERVRVPLPAGDDAADQ